MWIRNIILAFTGLAVVALGLHFAFKKSVMETLLKPSVVFDDSPQAEAPNYDLIDAWVAFPGLESQAMIAPASEGMALASPVADVFYIHPTGYFGTSSWNSPLTIPSFASEQTDLMLLGQASIFNECCNIYAPEYRQATYYSFFERASKDGLKALELAYSDIERAFDAFLSQRDPNLPFIIASHSQGTAHAMRLLAERVDKTPLVEDLVAAYTLGYKFPTDYFDRVYRDIKICESPYDQGCVVHWDSFVANAKDDGVSPHWYPTGWELSTNKPRVCINPINWSTTAYAPKTENLGALVIEIDVNYLSGPSNQPTGNQGQQLGLEIGKYGAQCNQHDGLLYVTNITDHSPFIKAMGDNGNLHIYDFNLFWSNVRENVLERSLLH